MSLELPLPTIDLHIMEKEYKKIKKKLDTHARILIVIYSILFTDYITNAFQSNQGEDHYCSKYPGLL